MGQAQSTREEPLPALQHSAIAQQVRQALDQHVMDYHQVEQFGLPAKLSRFVLIVIAVLIFLVISSKVTILDAILIAIAVAMAENIMNLF